MLRFANKQKYSNVSSKSYFLLFYLVTSLIFLYNFNIYLLYEVYSIQPFDISAFKLL